MATQKLKRRSASLQDTFWSTFDVNSGDKCWIWFGAETTEGYHEAVAIIAKEPTYIYFGEANDGEPSSRIEIKLPFKTEDGGAYIWVASLREVMALILRDCKQPRSSKKAARLHAMLATLEHQAAKAFREMSAA